MAFLVSVAEEHLTVQKMNLNDFSLDEAGSTINVPGLENLEETRF